MTQRDFEMTCLSIYHYNEEVGIIMMLCFVLLLMMGCVLLSDGCFPFPDLNSLHDLCACLTCVCTNRTKYLFVVHFYVESYTTGWSLQEK